MHALIDNAGLFPPNKQEEQLVRALTPRLAGFIVENPHVIAKVQQVMGKRGKKARKQRRPRGRTRRTRRSR